MSKINLYHMNNMEYEAPKLANLIYADHIYDNKDFSWIDKYWNFLVPNGIFTIHTDSKLVHRLKVYMEDIIQAVWVNDIIVTQRWGGVPTNKFAEKHDTILIYAKGKDWYWNSGSIQIPKQMVHKGFNPSGRTTKTPDTVWEDLGNFSTTSGERIKKETGKNIQWQKPLKQLRRLFTPFVKEDDFIIDPFLGSGTSAVIAKELRCDFDGIEYDEVPYELAKERLGL